MPSARAEDRYGFDLMYSFTAEEIVFMILIEK
jgi:hypothetical protein